MEELKKFGLVYLATPYTNYRFGHHTAFDDATRLTCRMQLHGVSVFSPVVYGHPLSYGDGGSLDALDKALWNRLNAPFMRVCDAIAVGTLEGWDESEGVQHEVTQFRRQGKPVFFVGPENLAVMTYWGDLHVVS